ncbi:MAG TPA: trehalose-6-phosphate synthase [Xanthobacteraceae bacterium]|nr:trehalose-6-phosphate synthase [Xanthobacteraceae bacterium]
MKFVIRYGLAALLMVTAMVVLIPPFAASLIEQWSESDVESRSVLAFNTALDELTDLLNEHDAKKIEALFERMSLDEQLLAVGFCDHNGVLVYKTKAMPKNFVCKAPTTNRTPQFSTLHLGGRSLMVSSFPVTTPEERGQMVLVHDLAVVAQRGAKAKLWTIAILIGVVFLAAAFAGLVTILLARRWLQSLRRAIDDVRLGRSGAVAATEATPFAGELRHLLRDLQISQLPAEGPDVEWSPVMLRSVLARKLPGAEVIVVSNREPYIHNREGDEIVLQIPASGLVAALEPIMRACGGTWLAHGSGSADAETVDRFDRIRVPPPQPSYTLRRVWLTEDEQNGYYYGFANEGLWPLCHMAFVRPNFRESDWEQYKLVNARYAQAVADEAKQSDPIILVQDYHFALLPSMLRKKLPNATIITFWHIPWPNPEIFGICPWKEDIIAGLLGSSVIGFHTRFHCNNFLDTVDRFMEARTDREYSLISFKSHDTLVRPYPISIEWPPAAMVGQKPVAECRSLVRNRFGLDDQTRLGVGIERFDYTKGILDRLRSIDALLSRCPEWKGKFVFVQVAAPTRSKLAAYTGLQKEAIELARQINARHGSEAYQPILLIIRHYEPHEIFELFRAADLCIVSSLHDGMNLVAKEFVAARDDEEGVLLLSDFAGASRELSEALIVNPHDLHSVSVAIEQALLMSRTEQRERMRLMREIVRLRNVYRWAGQMLLDAAELRTRSRIMRMASRLEPASGLSAARAVAR